MPQTLRRIVLGMFCMLALVVVGSSPAIASVESGRTVVSAAAKHAKKKPTICVKAYAVRQAVIKKHGKRAPGRNICRFGMSGGKKPTLSQKVRYLNTLRRLVKPPVLSTPSVVQAAVSFPQQAVSSAPSSTSTGVLPACASESGTNYSTGPDNTNPSGATGRYQEMPMHRQAGGVCYGIDLSPAGQDRCAVLIYQAQGAGAWVGCG